ncbi:MAG TPA: NHL repeat-containing protein [bacterium]|nr:NHL repeat-containing protein [bacterium]
MRKGKNFFVSLLLLSLFASMSYSEAASINHKTLVTSDVKTAQQSCSNPNALHTGITWNTNLHGKGKFWRPTDVSVDDGGTVYVVDSLNSRIQVFKPLLGHYVEYHFSIGDHRFEDFSFQWPVAIVPDGDRLFVFDAGWGKIFVLKKRSVEEHEHSPYFDPLYSLEKLIDADPSSYFEHTLYGNALFDTRQDTARARHDFSISLGAGGFPIGLFSKTGPHSLSLFLANYMGENVLFEIDMHNLDVVKTTILDKDNIMAEVRDYFNIENPSGGKIPENYNDNILADTASAEPSGSEFPAREKLPLKKMFGYYIIYELELNYCGGVEAGRNIDHNTTFHDRNDFDSGPEKIKTLFIHSEHSPKILEQRESQFAIKNVNGEVITTFVQEEMNSILEKGTVILLKEDNSGNIWLVDVYGDRIIKYDAKFDKKMTIGINRETPGYFSGSTQNTGITRICVNDSKEVFVYDEGKEKYLKFETDGYFIEEILNAENECDWSRVDYDAYSLLEEHDLLTSAADGIVLTVSKLLDLVASFTGDNEPDEAEIERAADEPETRVALSLLNRSVLNSLSYPRGVCFGPDGYLYISDSSNDRVVVVDSQGRLITIFGSEGTSAGEFQNPLGIAVDSQGYIYVVDNGNERIQKFQPIKKSSMPPAHQQTGTGMH